MTSKKYLIPLKLRPLLIVLVLELFLFNFPFWESFAFQTVPCSSVSLNGIEKINEHTYKMTEEGGRLSFRFNSVNIQNVHIQPLKQEAYSLRVGKGVNYKISIKDTGNTETPMPVGAQTVCNLLSTSHYIRIHPAGEVDEVNIYPQVAKGDSFSIVNISFNRHVPFYFSPIRFVLLCVLGYLVYAFSSKSRLFAMPLDLSDSIQMRLTVALILGVVLFAAATGKLIQPGVNLYSGDAYTENGSFIQDQNQYNHLSNALMEGHLYLDLTPPSWLDDMSNPYDAGARAALSQETGEATYWDYAYYNGHYYSYFGVLPALLTFVPFKLATGSDLRTDYAVVLYAVFFICSAACLIYQLIRRYFKSASFGIFLLACFLLSFGGGLLTQVFYPTVYSLPILSGLGFSFLGLAFWIHSAENNLKKTELVLGSLCIALTLECRPAYVLVCLFAFPIFWTELTEDRLFFSKKGLANTFAVLLPFFVVGVGALIYNYLRFDSFTEFGASYNLTGFDMVHQAHPLSRAFGGVYMFFFQPLRVEPSFPFLSEIGGLSSYHGELHIEPYYGGLFAFSPACLFIFTWPLVARGEQKRPIDINLFVIVCIALMLVFAITDVQVASISMRYQSDFAWLAVIASVLCLLSLLSAATINVRNHIIGWFSALVILGMVLSALNLFSIGRYGQLVSTNPALYYLVESWFIPFS